MSVRSLTLRSSLFVFRPAIPRIVPFQRRFYSAQLTPPEQDLTAQAELAAKVKELSPYHKVSFDERKLRIPWQDGKTSALYVPMPLLIYSLPSTNEYIISHAYF